MQNQRMRQLVRLLKWLIYLAVAAQIAGLGLFFFNGGELHLMIEGEIWSRRIEALNAADQLFVTAIISSSAAMLIWGMSHVAMLCRLYQGGMIFSIDCIQCFKKFAVALLLVAILETAAVPALVGYLWSRGVIPAFPEFDLPVLMDIVQVEIFMVGILFFVIARIMEVGAEMQDEMALTV